MDLDWSPKWDPTGPIDAWNSFRDRTWGLTWHQEFAPRRGKPTSYSKWGIRADAAGPYIEQAALWFESHPVVFHSYWNTNSAYPGKLSDGQYPNAGAAYQSAFGP